jgi:hypothetical protein
MNLVHHRPPLASIGEHVQFCTPAVQKAKRLRERKGSTRGPSSLSQLPAGGGGRTQNKTTGNNSGVSSYTYIPFTLSTVESPYTTTVMLMVMVFIEPKVAHIK